MIVRAAADALPLLTGGHPIVITMEGLPEAGALGLDGLTVWVAAPRGAVTLLHPLGEAAPGEASAVELPTPPVAVLAVVTVERGVAEPFLAWCAAESGLPAPPLLAAPDGMAALPPLAAELARTLAATAAREAALDGALTALRLELEETRIAAADMARRLAHLPPRPLRLVLDGSAGASLAAEGPLRLRAELGVMLAGLAAVAVHVASVPDGTGSMRLRLVAGESGRVAGSWLAHAAPLAPGWLTLDLPTPLGPIRESAVLEVSSNGTAVPVLSLDSRWSGLEGVHPLAVRAWSGEPGGRHLLPRFWDPEEVGMGRPVPGVPHALPAGAWHAARALSGEAPLAALGDEAPRPVLRAAPGGRAVILLPHLHAPGMDRLRVALTPASAAGARAAAWVLPAGAEVPDDGALDRADGAAGTGWRDLPEVGADLTVGLPEALGGRLQLAIGVQASADAPATAEISSVTLHASRPDVALPSLGQETDPPIPAPVASPSLPAEAPPALPAPEPAPPRDFTPAFSPAPPPGPLPPATGAIAPLPALSPFAAAVPFTLPPVPAPLPRPGPLTPPAALAPPPTARPRPAARSFEAWSPRTPAEPPRPSAPPGPTAAPVPDAIPASAAPLPWRAPVVPPPAPPAPLSAWTSAAPRGVAMRAPVPARHEAVRLHQHLPGDSYEHLDLTVVSLSRGTQRWPTVRVKLAMKDGDPRLEFRRAAGWPSMFQDWLGTGSDRFGPFLRVTLSELSEFLGRVTDERDAALMQALLAVLPQAGESAAREANLPPPAVARWVEAARQLQAAARPAQG